MKKNMKYFILAGLVSRQNKQKGMTMLEVIVAMLIIGLGLAMSISMIQASNRFGNNAEFSHLALEQAQAIIDKMRANSVAARSYEFTGGAIRSVDYDSMYRTVENETIYDSAIRGLNKICAPGFSAQDCNIPGGIAQSDMQAWSNDIRAALPGGRGLIFINGRNLEVVVMWSNTVEQESNLNPVAQGIRVNFTL